MQNGEFISRSQSVVANHSDAHEQSDLKKSSLITFDFPFLPKKEWFRSRAMLLGTLLAMALAMVGGAVGIIKLATDALLAEDARTSAVDWAKYIIGNADHLDNLFNQGMVTPWTMAVLRPAREVGDVFQFKFYDASGKLVLQSDDMSWSPGASILKPAPANAVGLPLPVEYFKAGHTYTKIEEAEKPGEPDFFAEAYVPVLDGKQFRGVVEVYVDQAKHRALVIRSLYGAMAGLAVLVLLSFGLPSLVLWRRTEQKRYAETKLRYLAHHDALTGLDNRARLVDRTDQLLKNLASRRIAFHFIDLDRFKEINDGLGHEAGDDFLRETSRRLRALVRSTDIVGRLGGDEFVVIQVDIKSEAEVEALASRIVKALAEPLRIGLQDVAAGASVGIAIAPEHGNDSARILKSADLALYKAKADGRNCHRFYNVSLDTELDRRLKLQGEVREAFQNKRFELFYQPQFDIVMRRLVGFEALMRLRRPDGTITPPAEFIPITEEMGLISPLGAWAIGEACLQAVRWGDDLSVAVNLSPAQFRAGDLVQTIADALQKTGIRPGRLEVEITENLLLENDERITDQITAIKALGVHVVMDDFGTGYSSLSYLWRYEFDKIKIDRSFLVGIGMGGNKDNLLRSIINLGQSLKLPVTVEGVETSEQADFLQKHDCQFVQGYLFAKPMPMPDVTEFILRSRAGGIPALQALIPGRAEMDAANVLAMIASAKSA